MTRELDELLGAYALDAVDASERAAIEQYLDANPRARAEVAEHREVATFLAYSGTAAPDELWSRIAGNLSERAPAPGAELAKVLPMRPRRGLAVRTLLPLVSGAAAAAVVTLGVLALSRPSGDDLLEQAASAARRDRDSVVVALRSPAGQAVEVIVDAEGHGYLLGDALPAIPADRSYQLWGVVEDEVISLGVFSDHPELETFTVTGDLSALALTIEERGGVPASEQPAAYSAEIA